MRAALAVLAVLALSHSLDAADPVAPSASASKSEESLFRDATLRLRIYNYATIHESTIAHAQAIVAGVFRDAGVRVVWEPMLTRPATVDPWTAPQLPAADVSIMLLDNARSRHINRDAGVVGSAAVSMTGLGSIAYVHAERVRRMAKNQDQVRDILSFVIAHELSHLLLPPGAHTESGLMRGEWSPGELRRLSIADFSLSEPQRGLLIDRVRGSRGNTSPVLSD